jgi:hypothetical protein
VHICALFPAFLFLRYGVDVDVVGVVVGPGTTGGGICGGSIDGSVTFTSGLLSPGASLFARDQKKMPNTSSRITTATMATAPTPESPL